MAKRQNPYAAAWVVLVVVTLILGCSSNNNTGTNPYTKLTGDPNDPIYRSVGGEVYFGTTYSQGMIKDIFDMLKQISPQVFPASSLPGSRSAARTAAGPAEYHDSSAYWVRMYTDTSAAADTSFSSYVDSIQFLQGSTPVQYPDSQLLTSIKMSSQHTIRYASVDDSLSFALEATLAGSAGAMAAGGNITINGAGFYVGLLTGESAKGADTACNRTFAYTLHLQDLHANISQVFYGTGCPSSGLVKHTGMLISECGPSADSLNYEKQWTAIATLDGAQIKFTIENPTTRWVNAIPCDRVGAPPATFEPEAPVITWRAQ